MIHLCASSPPADHTRSTITRVNIVFPAVPSSFRRKPHPLTPLRLPATPTSVRCPSKVFSVGLRRHRRSSRRAVDAVEFISTCSTPYFLAIAPKHFPCSQSIRNHNFGMNSTIFGILLFHVISNLPEFRSPSYELRFHRFKFVNSYKVDTFPQYLFIIFGFYLICI